MRGLLLHEQSRRLKRLAAAFLVPCVVAGCASLPPPVRNTGTVAPAPLQLDSNKGLLSPAQSQAVLAHVGRRGPDTNIFDYHLAVEESLAPSRLVVGNKVTLLEDGLNTYVAMYKAIKEARDHINFETYIIENDEIGRKFALTLIEKQRAGVQVNVIYDSVGSMNTPRAFFDEMKSHGINVLEFNPINPLRGNKGWQINQRDHRKLLILDGKVVFVGGVNISAVYSGGSAMSHPKYSDTAINILWRDTHLQIDGPVVASFQKLFLETWEKQRGTPLLEKQYFPLLTEKGREVIRAIGSSSDIRGASKGSTSVPINTTTVTANQTSQMYSTLLSAIDSAETAINLTMAYFVPDPELLQALRSAVVRGVDVKIILPSYTDSGMVFHAGRSYYTHLLEGGVQIYERRGKLLHAKTVSIDGVWSSVGSTNFDWRSMLHNDEVNAVVLGTEFGTQMGAMFAKDLAASHQITLSDWQQRGIVFRFMESAARIWAYWL